MANEMLILEGGAMRGMFTAGVLDVFMENGITFDAAVGVSAGAVFGCNIKSRQIGRVIRYNKRFCRDKRYCSLWSLLRTGDLYGAEFCYRTLPNELDVFDRETFKDNPMEFYAVATDVSTGKAVMHKCVDGGDVDLDWMRASASMPIVSMPVMIDGKGYLDGGIAEPIPVKMAMDELGCKKCCVILTQPDGFVKEKDSTTKLIRLLYNRKYPEIVKAMERRHEVYNSSLRLVKELEQKGEVFAIRPKQPLGIGRTEKDPNELERVYQEGRKTAKEALPKLMEHLGK